MRYYVIRRPNLFYDLLLATEVEMKKSVFVALLVTAIFLPSCTLAAIPTPTPAATATPIPTATVTRIPTLTPTPTVVPLSYEQKEKLLESNIRNLVANCFRDMPKQFMCVKARIQEYDSNVMIIEDKASVVIVGELTVLKDGAEQVYPFRWFADFVSYDSGRTWRPNNRILPVPDVRLKSARDYTLGITGCDWGKILRVSSNAGCISLHADDVVVEYFRTNVEITVRGFIAANSLNFEPESFAVGPKQFETAPDRLTAVELVWLGELGLQNGEWKILSGIPKWGRVSTSCESAEKCSFN